LPTYLFTSRANLSLRLSLHHTAPTYIYTLSLHDALPIYGNGKLLPCELNYLDKLVLTYDHKFFSIEFAALSLSNPDNNKYMCKLDRKSTRLNSSHVKISYGGFCLKEKKDLIALCRYMLYQ